MKKLGSLLLLLAVSMFAVGCGDDTATNGDEDNGNSADTDENGSNGKDTDTDDDPTDDDE